MPLVELVDVAKTFARQGGPSVYAVDAATLDVDARQTLALIGESGSGKSTVGRLALGLLTPDRGRVRFDGTDLSTLSPRALRRVRRQLMVVFQEPFESLNPRMTVRRIVGEPLRIHAREASAAQRGARVEEALTQVGLPDHLWDRFPATLSGGQQQRVGIARAIITRPRFIVLDEPTSSLDLSVRAQILGLLQRLQAELGLAYLLISHDIGTVRHVSQRVAVMYRGRIVEAGATARVLASPQHPYTKALLSASLSVDPDETPHHFPLSGEIPRPTELATGCVLYGRCPLQGEDCTVTPIPLSPHQPGHDVACLRVPVLSPGRVPSSG